jgi:hypothetical protein
MSDLLDDLFHGCALTAYLEQAAAQRDWPDIEATRVRAYRHYEQALALKNRSDTSPSTRRDVA